MQNGKFESKIFFSKNMPKMNLKEQLSCSVQKTARKNSQYSRNETIVKIDHGQNGQFGSKIFFSKNMPKVNLEEERLVLCKKALEKIIFE